MSARKLQWPTTGPAGGDQMKDRLHDDVMAEAFRESPSEAQELLESIFEDGEPGDLQLFLRQVNKAVGDTGAQPRKDGMA
jgi:DNA-binding phage protein